MDNMSITNERIEALHSVDLKTANRDMEAILRSNEFVAEAKQALRHDDFFEQALEKFSFQIVPDSERFHKDEPEYGTIFDEGRFNWQLRNFDDLLAQVIHTSLHEWCETAWITTPTPKQTFTAVELDVLEEIYGQALMYKIAPDIHDLFTDNLREYFEWINSNTAETDPVFEQIFQLMGCKLDTPMDNQVFNAARYWLYTQDPTDLSTYRKYMALCETLIDKTDLRDLIQKYYDLLGGDIEWL